MKLPILPDYDEPVDKYYAGAFVTSVFTTYIIGAVATIV
jgi:hypothetical protein